MFARLSAFWQGRIYFSALGGNPALFLNQAMKDGIVLYHTQKAEHGLRAVVSLTDFPRLREAARLSRSRVKIIAKYGWPFIARRWWRRKGLILGAAVIGISLSILSQLVLFITVSGNKVIDTADILKEANALGLKTWVWHRSLDLNQIAAKLQDDFPDAAWVGISRKGTHVGITVVEKKRVQAHTEAGNLVAAKNGLVQEIMVIQGTSQVHEGEMVKAGQVLITAPQPPPNSPQASPPGQNAANAKQGNAGTSGTSGAKPGGGAAGSNSTGGSAGSAPKGLTRNAPAAKGFVRGRVWYSAEAKVPLVEDKVVATGQQSKGYGIKFGARVIMVTTPDSPYPLADKEVESTPLFTWRNWRFPVEVITVTYKELEQVHLERTPAQARQAAENEARQEVNAKLTPGIIPVEERVRVLASTPGAERVRIEVETYEDLAVYPNP